MMEKKQKRRSAQAIVFPVRDTGNIRGRETRELIIRTALEVMVEEGYSAMSMRRVAAAAGIKFGNLTYHFPTREALLVELFETVFGYYEHEFERNVSAGKPSAEEALVLYVELMFGYMNDRTSICFLPEVWALSNHDAFVSDRMYEMYVRARAPLEAIITELRPDLSSDLVGLVALFMSASMEAHMLFVGMGKPYHDVAPAFQKVTVKSFVNLVKTIDAKDLKGVSFKLGPHAKSTRRR